MEEILASIRRIIADEDSGKAAKPAAVPPAAVAPAPPPPKPVPAPPPVAAKPAPPPPPPPKPVNNQADVDAMLASMDAAPKPEPKPEPKPAPKPPEAVTPPPAMPAADVLDLTEAMATPVPPAQSFRRIDAASDVVFAEETNEPAEPPPAPQSPVIDRSLLSNATRSAVDSAFHSLANTVLGNNARTLEDLVKEMLRPMLKSWLDDNLPGLVERIVRAEIERVSRGGR